MTTRTRPRSRRAALPAPQLDAIFQSLGLKPQRHAPDHKYARATDTTTPASASMARGVAERA